MEKVLLVKEAAEKLRVHRNMIYLLCKEKKLRHTRVGRKILIPEWVLDEYIKDQLCESEC